MYINTTTLQVIHISYIQIQIAQQQKSASDTPAFAKTGTLSNTAILATS